MPPEVDWLWMTYCKMDDMHKAMGCLNAVDGSTPVSGGDISYKRRVLLKRGLMSEEDFVNSLDYSSDSSLSTELYGLASYYYYIKHDVVKALEYIEKTLDVKTCHHSYGYKMALADKRMVESCINRN